MIIEKDDTVELKINANDLLNSTVLLLMMKEKAKEKGQKRMEKLLSVATEAMDFIWSVYFDSVEVKEK